MSNPSNPRLYPPYRIIDGINPDSPDSQQMEQIDQLNVFLLQDIDEKFSNFHQVITTRLIPAVKKFNAVSEPTREAAKFWRTFFEAAAAVRVPVPSDYQLDPSAPPSSAHQHDPNASLPHGSAQSSESSFFADLPRGGVSSTPVHQRYQQGAGDDQATPSSTADFFVESPADRFSRLAQQDVDHNQSQSSMGSSSYGLGPGGSTAGAARKPDPRNDADYDSDADSPDASFAEGYEDEAPTPQANRHLPPLGNAAEALANLTISSSGLPNFPVPIQSTTSGFRSSTASNQNTATLGRSQDRPRPSASTPRQAQASSRTGAPLTPSNPFRSTPGQPSWNGLADLRSTPLTVTSKPAHQLRQAQPPLQASYAGAAGSDSDESDDDALWPKGMSPPKTMNFTMPPSAKKKAPERMVPVDISHGGGAIGERVMDRLLAGTGVGGPAAMPTPPRPPYAQHGIPPRQYDAEDEDKYEEEDSIGAGGNSRDAPPPPLHMSSIPGSASSSQAYSQQEQPYYNPSLPPGSASSSSSYHHHPSQAPLINPTFSGTSSSSHYSHAPRPTHEDDNDSSSSSSSNSSDDLGGRLERDLSISHLDHHPPPPPPPQPQSLQASIQSMASSSGYKAVPPQTELDESFDDSEDEMGDDTRFEMEEEHRLEMEAQQQQGGAAYGRRESNLINFDDPFAGAAGASSVGGAKYGAGLQGKWGAPAGGEGAGRNKFLLGARDEMLTFNGGRLEDAPLTESPTPFMGKK